MRDTFDKALYQQGRLTLPKPEITLDRATVICALAALRVITTGKCRKNDCQTAIERAYGQVRSNAFLALMEVRDGLAALDKSPLVPFLECAHDLLPGFIADQKRINQSDDDFIRAALVELSNQGLMQQYNRPWPEVQKWVGSAIDAILTPLERSLAIQLKSGVAAADFCLVSQLLLAQSTCVLFDYFYNMDSCKTSTIICGVESYAITEIETSVMAGVMRHLLKNLSETEREAFIRRCEEFAGKQLQTWRIMDSNFADLTAILNTFLSMRDNFRYVAERNNAFVNLTSLSEQLKKFSCCTDVSVAPMSFRDLPIGEVAVAILEKNEVLMTKYDGRKSLIHVAVTTGDLANIFDIERCDPASAETRTAVVNGMMGVCLDQDGNLISAWEDRHLPPPSYCSWYDRTLRAAHTIEAITYPILQQEWQLHPDLFSSLSSSSPIVIIAGEKERFIAVEKGSALAQDFELVSLEGMEDVFAFFHPRGTEIHRLPELTAEFDLPVYQNESEKLVWRRIYKALPGGKLSFEWLFNSLAPFGVELMPDGGKGSHYKLIRNRADGERSYTVSKRFRRETNAANNLREIVAALGISLEEFADSLS